MSTWYVYLVRTRDGALYTGTTTDVARRLAEHEGGGARGSKYLRARAPLRLAYRARIGSRSLALRAEARLKRLPKREKEDIVTANPIPRTLLRMLALP